MKIHEYQGKEIFKRYGVPVPRNIPATTPEEAHAAAEKLIAETGIPVVVVKSQIHAGGRGKGQVHKGNNVVARGVEVIKGGADAAQDAAWRMLGGRLVTIQSGPEGKTVHTVLVEQVVRDPVATAWFTDKGMPQFAVTENIAGVESTAADTGAAAARVRDSARGIADQSQSLARQVQSFMDGLRSA